MRTHSLLAMLFGVALTLVAFAPSARASEADQMTKFTFNEPVEIPGHEVLPAESYWFVLATLPGDPNVVEVYGSNWKRRFATLLTQPTIRQQATGNTVVKLAERPHDRPEALLKWYYPGRLTGHEFLYSPRRERALSRDMQQTVLVRSSTRSEKVFY
jgi:hypothetical protein